MATFITSDLHLYHHNILKYCNRPWDNIDDMNMEIINRYIDTVSHNDNVLILGDITIKRNSSFKPILARIIKSLPGKKHLVLGNHDYYSKKFYLEECGFLSVQKRIETNEYIIVHDPNNFSKDDLNSKKILLHGHVHSYSQPLNIFVSRNNIKTKKIFDVGVDASDFCPVSLKNIRKIIKNT